MKVTSQIEEARRLHSDAIERMDEQDAKIQSLPDDTPDEERAFHKALFDKYVEDEKRCRETLERLVAIQRARQTLAPVDNDKDEDEKRDNGRPAGSLTVKEPLTYRRTSPHSFFGDMYHARVNDDPAAQKRLHQHKQEMRVERGLEARDLTTGDPGGAGFIPPIYLGEKWIESPRAGRPFANQLPQLPLTEVGMRVDFPRVQTGAAAAIQATENSGAQETDLDSETYSVNVRTIAGQNDVSRQLLERSQPGMDEVIFSDLLADYDAKLDTQLLSGSGSSGQHTGIFIQSGINAVTYTDGTPTSAELVPKVYDAIQQVASNRFREATLIVMHPRRGAWLASNLSSTFPLFQLGGLLQAAGAQNNGFVSNLAGLTVVLDANVRTTLGTGTNEDEIGVVRAEDLILMEGTIATRVFEDVGSGTLTVRLQVYAYSAFAIRLAKAVSRISGTGLTAPTF